MKNLCLVIHCTSKPGRAINYSYNKDTDVYVVYNFSLLHQHVGKLLKDYQNGEISVVLLYKQLPALLEATKLLYQESNEEKKQKVYNDYKSSYKRQLAIVTGNTGAGGALNTDFDVKLPQGHSDKTLGFETFFIFDTTGFEPSDHLSESNTGKQQLLRFLALKHGGYYGAISGKLEELEDPETCQLFLLSLKGGLSKEEEQHIFTAKGDPITDNINSHQRIALGWDSWSKIQMVARSISRRDDWGLLDEEVKLAELDDLYEAFLRKEGQDFLGKAKEIVGFKEPPEKASPPPMLTYNDVIKKLEEAISG
ncbi:hypothetical protein FT663_02805 [Candidozyma haemuli var. vulneris]|uniref:Uncharacterized protein n=1 Tax=Candidozyma haemuli TaxID=45357 RepID=A0A2V1AY18_9ASCO|nr:hypothetical protein CXQ85_005223 [[Candida] haemuloni]KAF3991304.1 hypothetical protein FT663_02805 [[Candida] haemuloni var. vulneris]KAF3991990.1 hypothetical protein FT662_01443 [[Candida] haemuloni var. vulneris]PVH22649.1 hypothetical protein CXQ85_005223 [[Candida] haemuloni]